MVIGPHIALRKNALNMRDLPIRKLGTILHEDAVAFERVCVDNGLLRYTAFQPN